MIRKQRIETMFKGFTWSEKKKTFISLTAFENQIKLMNSFKKQYDEKGDLSDKQICVGENIIEQNRAFSRSFRMARCSY